MQNFQKKTKTVIREINRCGFRVLKKDKKNKTKRKIQGRTADFPVCMEIEY